MTNLNVQLLLTGDELMIGDIVDSNSAMIAKHLKALGINIKKKVTVADNLSDLVSEIKHMSSTADILIINGGLGPTSDDLTSQALSNATGRPLVENPLAINHLKKWCAYRNIALNKPNLKQAILPKDSDIISNSIGSAVGIKLIHNNCTIYCTPGVPSELKIMLSEEIIPEIASHFVTQNKTNITRLQIFGIGESKLQLMIDEHFPNWPAEIEIGYRADMPTVELKLITHSTFAHSLKKQWLTKIKNLLGDHILDEIIQEPVNLAEHVLRLLIANKLKITTAESCTGGLIASLLTENPGSSSAFEAGFVTYSNKIKNQILAVPEKTIETYGAVSQETVIAMAQGALSKASADFVIAVSGIAGPNGGTQDKPVGTVWIAWGDKKNIEAQSFKISGSRKYFQIMVAARSLDLIRRRLIKSTQIPFYSTFT
ncbi:MAG: nicotinamide-nucleotide amidase [Alteromonadaceae bacterium]|jgi:nicotinamide-nucleotide amidase